MISQGEVIRKFEKLLKEVATSDFYKVDLTNRVNCYTCSCGHITKTKDVDSGVTPMFFDCERCGGDASSSGYRDIVPHQEPTIEWYRPRLIDLIKMRHKTFLLEHVLKGGLMHRKIINP
jgi:hypothetical protein